MLILLAEDSDTLRSALRKHLISSGHEVHSVENGWHAVLSYHAYTYDIIFMDMHMPLMDGWDATQMIRDLEQVHTRKRVPIVAVTSLFDRQACLAGGLDDHMSKPFSPMQLYTILTRWIMKKKAAEQTTKVDTATPTEHQPDSAQLS